MSRKEIPLVEPQPKNSVSRSLWQK